MTVTACATRPTSNRMPDPLDYKAAGLDLDVYEDTIGRIGRLAKKTHGPGVLDGFGGFASLFSLDFNRRLFARNYRNPVLVTCTDGVGTKLKVAALLSKYDTVGIDLVAMSVNDCLCSRRPSRSSSSTTWPCPRTTRP